MAAPRDTLVPKLLSGGGAVEAPEGNHYIIMHHKRCIRLTFNTLRIILDAL